MAQLEKSQLHLGYIPLLDCVALLWAKQRGFFEEVGLDVSLVKEASWASLRDRLAFGFLDAAHCLSAMLPAAALAQDQLGIPLQTPLVLSYNSAFISLSQKLCYALDIKKTDDAATTAQKFFSAMQHEQYLPIAHVFGVTSSNAQTSTQFSQAFVMSRGIIGDLQGERVVASPIYKQHFSLATGRCLEDKDQKLLVFPSKIENGRVWISPTPQKTYITNTGASQEKMKLVLVGNGLAGMRCLEDLLEQMVALSGSKSTPLPPDLAEDCA
jgi:hypothetical protein